MQNVMLDKTRKLNDELRRFGKGGTWVLSQAVAALPHETQRDIIMEIRTYEDFNKDNDPYGEHDFVCVHFRGVRYIARINYYDNSLRERSSNPSDPSVTKRIMTIMRADEL